MTSPLSRRDLLTRSTTLAALGASGAVAGCAELDVLGGADTGLGEELRTWLPAPATFPGEESSDGTYYFWGTDLARIRSSPDRLEALFNGPEQSRVDHLGVDVGDVERRFSISFYVTVWTGEFDGDAVVDSLRDTGFEPDGTTVDARLFEGSLSRGGSDTDARPHRVAVGDSYVVEMPLGANAMAASTVDHLVETHDGDVQRYGEANADLDTLLDAQQGSLSVSGRAFERVDESAADPEVGLFAGLVARGATGELADDVLRLHQVSVFDDPSDVDREALETYTEQTTESDGDDGFPDYEHAETTVDGRVARVVLETPVDDLPTPTTSR